MEEQYRELKILEVAEDLFLRQGFVKTTTMQIAKAAGCNQALVHYYYRTKERLFERIFGEKVELLLANILNVNVRARTLEERVVGMIDAHFDFLRQNPLLLSFLLRELLTGSAIVGAFVEKLKVTMQTVLERMDGDINDEIEKGNISPISARDLLLTIVSMDIMPFMYVSIKVLDISEDELPEFYEQRKNEIKQTILSRLKP